MTASPDAAAPAALGSCETEAEPPRGLVLDLVVEDETVWGPAANAERAVEDGARAVAQRLGLVRAEAGVVLSVDARVRELNRTYRGTDRATNVLSFPAAPAGRHASGTRYLGDIILAGETVAREAAEQAKPVLHHLQHLLVHGLLHLVGYDHGSAEQAREMERLEVEILGRIGVRDPYAGGGE